jgi:hypothetical protein
MAFSGRFNWNGLLEFIMEEIGSPLLNYPWRTDMEVGILLHFGKKSEFRGKVYENIRKRKY